MRKNLRSLTRGVIMIAALQVLGTGAFAQGMAVNGTGASADASAILDMASTTKGVLIPRMTKAERDLIGTPAAGLLIYQTNNTPGFYYYNSGWVAIGGSSSGSAGGDLTGSYPSPTLSGSAATGANVVTAINASSSAINAARLQNTVTTKGNTFNGNSQLLELGSTALVPTANLGTGTASSTTYLRGDGTWTTPPIGNGEYAYVYNTSTQFVTLGNAVAFDSNGPLSSNITHNAGSSFIFINVSGVYKIEFSASSAQPSQFSVYQNGVSVTGSRYGQGTTSSQNMGMVIVNVTAGDVIQLNNTGSAASTNLAANTGGTLTAVNASIMITKL